ncbi:MAG: PD-(D/E)XK nuclease family protein, partial [Clostridia bacterium]
MLHLITGEKGTGKTEYAYEILSQIVQNEEKGVLIVPKHFTFDSDKGVLHKLGPQKASEVEVLSFTRLADTVLKTYAGIHKPLLPQGAKSVYMALALKNVKHELRVFQKQKNEIALVDMMLEIIDEFKTEVVDLDALREITGEITDNSLREKLEGILLVNDTYDAIIENSFFDTTKLMTRIFEILLDKDFFKGKTIAIDGFYTFSQQELNLIMLMIKQAKDVYITLCTDEMYSVNQLSPFNIANETAKQLKHIADKEGASVQLKKMQTQNHQTNEVLQVVTKNLYDLNAQVHETSSKACTVASLSSLSLECDYVASQIRQKVMFDGYRYREIMVVFRDATMYDEHIKQAFKKYEIPIFDDKRQPIMAQPLILALSNLLAICGGSFSTDYIFRYLKTGVTKFTNDQIFDLENYVFMWDIDGKMWQDRFVENIKGFGSTNTQSSIERLEALNEVRFELISPIQKLKEDMKDKTGKQIASLVYAFLIENGFDESLKSYALELVKDGKTELAQEQEQVWDLLMEILDELAMSLDQNAVSSKMFSELFTLVVASKSLGNLPDGFDQVMVCDAQRAVIKKAKCVFVLGLNDGIFPKVSAQEGFLKDSERLKLNSYIQSKGFEIEKQVQRRAHEERFLMQSVFASASEQLHLSYASSGAKGEKLQKSSVISKVIEVLPNAPYKNVGENDVIDFASTEKSAFEAYGKLYGSNNPKFAALHEYFQKRPEYKGRIQSIARAHAKATYSFENPSVSKTLFGKNMFMSASRIEDYNKCQFMYFCKFGVGAKPRRKAKFDPMQSGTVVHWVLEKMLMHYKQKTFMEKSNEQLKTKIKLYLDEYVTLYMGGLDGKDARFNYLYNRMQKTLEDLFLRLKIEFEQSEFEPWKYELEITKNGEVKPFKVQLDDGYVELGGIVDRVDKMDVEGKRYIRVVDYKTGSKEFELCEVLHGLNMQMLLYLMAIWKSEEKEYKDSVPAGILYFPARSEMYSAKRGEDDDKKLDNRLKANCKMNGMILDDETV